jgi:2-dehydropantoate 2-reductase
MTIVTHPGSDSAARPLRTLVVGAGAVGGYFGGRLAAAGRDVTFLVRSGRAEQLRRDGLQIVSPHGDAVLRPALVSATEIDSAYELIFLSVKGYQLDSVLADFARAVGPATMILPVLNGLRHVAALQKRFGAAAVIGGVCIIASEVDRSGRVVQLSDTQYLRYGELDKEVTARIRRVDSTLQIPGLDTGLSQDITQAMWEKWVQLAALGAVTCLLRAPVGDVVAVADGAELALEILNECAAIATACGHRPSVSFLDAQARALTTQGSPLTSSMFRDLRSGAPVEVDQILGDLIERGRSQGIDTPLLRAACAGLQIYQRSGHR